MADDVKNDKASADARKLQQAEDGKKAMLDYEAEAAALRAKTEKLRALRLARDAAMPAARSRPRSRQPRIRQDGEGQAAAAVGVVGRAEKGRAARLSWRRVACADACGDDLVTIAHADPPRHRCGSAVRGGVRAAMVGAPRAGEARRRPARSARHRRRARAPSPRRGRAAAREGRADRHRRPLRSRRADGTAHADASRRPFGRRGGGRGARGVACGPARARRARLHAALPIWSRT